MTHPPHHGRRRRLPAAPATCPSWRIGARPLVARWPRILPVLLLAVAALVGCGDTRPARQPEGSVAFHTGSGPQAENLVYTLPGPPFQHPGMLAPSQEQPRQSVWVDEDQEHPLLKGATAGMTTGIGFMMVTPMALTFWPAAVGIVVGSTAMAMLGVAQSDSADVRLSPPDQTVIVAATKEVQPDRLLRESLRQALRNRARDALPIVLWQLAGGVESDGTDPLAEARARGLDGFLECAVEALGLAAGEERGHLWRLHPGARCAPWTRATDNCGTSGSCGTGQARPWRGCRDRTSTPSSSWRPIRGACIARSHPTPSAGSHDCWRRIPSSRSPRLGPEQQ